MLLLLNTFQEWRGDIVKKTILVVFLSILFMGLVGCSANKSVEFKEFYSEVIGFDKNDKKLKPIEHDAILMITNDNFQEFKDKYFTPREIPMDSPDKEKAVLYLQIPSSTSRVNTYGVESINIKNNTLAVNLKKSAVTQVDGKGGFNGIWKWVMFIEVDKADLKDNMKIVIKK